MTAPASRVFISYYHEGPAHRDQVRRLARRLDDAGFNVVIDQDLESTPPMGWYVWSSRQIENAAHVLVVCTAGYRARFNREEPTPEKGSVWEAGAIVNDLATNARAAEKYIMILMNGADIGDIIAPLRGHDRFQIPEDFEKLRERLRKSQAGALTKSKANTPAAPGERNLAGGAGRPGRPGLRSPRPPSRLWAAIIGRIAWHRGQEALKQLREAALGARIGNNLEDVLNEGDVRFVVPFQAWDTRPPVAVSKRPLVVVSGAAGAGKTRHFNELFREFAETSDLVAELPTTALRTALDAGGAGPLWELILAQTAGRATPGTLRPSAVAHALNARRVVLVVDDVHTIGTVEDVWARLNGYLARHHRPGRGVTVLMTTRENVNPATLPADTMVRLEPLSMIEAGEFFWLLCEKNDVAVDPANIGQVLAQAFQASTTRTPLFVVICAWLARVSPEHRADVAGLLRLRSTEVFQRFINTLFTRSAREDGLTFARFMEVYRAVALAYWPIARGLLEEAVEETIAALQQGDPEPAVTPSFLRDNGFLARDPGVLDLPRISFPHQAIADLLVAQRMVRALDFGDLRRRGSVAARHGLPEVLGQLIEDPEVLLALARDELGTLVQVLEAHPALPDHLRCRTQGWLGAVAEQAAHWASPEATYAQPPECWRGVGRLLGDDPAVRERFRATVARTGPSAIAMEVLSVLNWPETQRVLHDWIDTPGGLELLRSRLDSPYIRAFLTVAMESDAPMDRWRAFRAAREAPDPELRVAVERYLEAAATSLSPDQIREVAALGASRLAALARGLETASAMVKRRVSGAVVSAIRKALLSPGTYVVRDGGRSIEVRVSPAVLVPQSPTYVEGPFHGQATAVSAVAGQTRGQLVLTRDQLLVLLQCYADPYLELDPNGVVFHKPGKPGYEVVRDTGNELVLLTIWHPDGVPMSGTEVSVIDKSKAPVPMVYPRVAYRLIEPI